MDINRDVSKHQKIKVLNCPATGAKSKTNKQTKNTFQNIIIEQSCTVKVSAGAELSELDLDISHVHKKFETRDMMNFVGGR